MCQLLLGAGADPQQPDFHGYLPYEQAEAPEVRVLLGGPDQRLFDYAGEGGEAGGCGVVRCGALYVSAVLIIEYAYGLLSVKATCTSWRLCCEAVVRSLRECMPPCTGAYRLGCCCRS